MTGFDQSQVDLMLRLSGERLVAYRNPALAQGTSISELLLDVTSRSREHTDWPGENFGLMTKSVNSKD